MLLCRLYVKMHLCGHLLGDLVFHLPWIELAKDCACFLLSKEEDLRMKDFMAIMWKKLTSIIAIFLVSLLRVTLSEEKTFGYHSTNSDVLNTLPYERRIWTNYRYYKVPLWSLVCSCYCSTWYGSCYQDYVLAELIKCDLWPADADNHNALRCAVDDVCELSTLICYQL